MGSKPQVTLTLAGDESKLSRAFDAASAASKRMADDVGAASKKVGEETADGFDRAAEASDNTYDKFDALESVGRGTTDTMSGLGEIMKGNILQGSTDLAGGVAALADGFTGALLPAIKAASKASITSAVSTARQTAATVASRVATLAGAAATFVMAGAQRALNLAMRANPIGLIITALILLGTGLVIAYRKSETFRNIVNAAFRGVQIVVGAVVGWITGHWKLLFVILTGPIGLAVLAIAKHRDSILGFFRGIPGAIGGFFRGIGSAVASPFQAAFAAIRSAWNSTVGGKGFDIPGWVPNLGGKSFRIPYFHTGGIVGGGMGSETLAVLKAGERVTGGRNDAGTSFVFTSDGSRAGELLLQLFKETLRVRDQQAYQVVFAR